MKHYLALICFMLLILSMFMQAVQAQIAAESLVGWWTFEVEEDLTGNFEEFVLNGASLKSGQLDVDAGKWAYAGGYTGPDITEKTLVSWAYLEDLTVTAGSIITLDKISEDEFNGIIFAERQPGRWMNGSSFFRRTQDAEPGFEETKTDQLVHMAISYEDDGGCHVRIYHNGDLIGDYTSGDLPTWEAGDAEVFWGKRHGNTGGGPGDLDALIEESRIYNAVLSEAEIQAMQLGGAPVEARGKLATVWADMKRQ